jgi:hypothetical protein
MAYRISADRAARHEPPLPPHPLRRSTHVRRWEICARIGFPPDFSEVRREAEFGYPAKQILEIDRLAILTQQHCGVGTIDQATGNQREASVATGSLTAGQVFQELDFRSLVVVHLSRVPVTVGSL